MNFLRVLGEMWGVYTSSALPFLLIHVFVLLTVIWLFAEIRKEIRAQPAWPATRGNVLKLSIVRERMPRLFAAFRPDYHSQTALTRTSPVTSSLHSRVNLFLVVGVAGTFFALFQFALKVSGAGADVAKSLREGLVLAFPVGFFGLVWTLLGHYAAFALEQELRRSVNGAIQRVMGQRQAYSHSVLDEISAALKPLKDLQGTLGETLQPVLESLRAELAMAAAIDEFRATADSPEPAAFVGGGPRRPSALGAVAEIRQARQPPGTGGTRLVGIGCRVERLGRLVETYDHLSDAFAKSSPDSTKGPGSRACMIV
jgi:hypothetical protein